MPTDDTATQLEREGELLEREQHAQRDPEVASLERRLEAAKARMAGTLDKGPAPVINEDGSTGTELELWQFDFLDFMGEQWEYRVPKPLASMFLGITARRTTSGRRKLDAILGFLEHTLSPKSFERLQERALDHEDELDVREMSDLIGKIMEAGSARPTG